MVVIYADFSGTRVSRRASVIMSRVGDKVAYKVCPVMNYLTAWNFVRGLKEALEVSNDASVIFVTDGEEAWIDPKRSFFPDAVHMRQFHFKNSKGIIYVHVPYDGEVYTVRFPWDVVLDGYHLHRGYASPPGAMDLFRPGSLFYPQHMGTFREAL